MEDEVVLTYGDTTLFQNDLCALHHSNWLTDKIITFYFEYDSLRRILIVIVAQDQEEGLYGEKLFNFAFFPFLYPSSLLSIHI